MSSEIGELYVGLETAEEVATLWAKVAYSLPCISASGQYGV